MKISHKKALAIPVAALALVAGSAAAGYASLAGAQTTGTDTTTTSTATSQPTFEGMRKMGPHVHGTIAAINGTTITVTGKDNILYTVEASTASIMTSTEGSAPAAGTIASLAVGDEIDVRGTISGTSVTATAIMEGMPGRGGMGIGRGHGKGPGVIGTVSAVNGNTITVTGENGTSYTIEAGSASVKRMVAGTLADISVGDKIGVQGTVSGTSVTAAEIMDDLPAKAQ